MYDKFSKIAIENKSDGRKSLEKISQPKIVNDRKYKGFNLFDHIEQNLLMKILRGGFNISGFKNYDIRKWFPSFSPVKVSRLLGRFRCHGLIKKVAGTHKYYATKLAKETILLGKKIKEFVMIPAWNY